MRDQSADEPTAAIVRHGTLDLLRRAWGGKDRLRQLNFKSLNELDLDGRAELVSLDTGEPIKAIHAMCGEDGDVVLSGTGDSDAPKNRHGVGPVLLTIGEDSKGRLTVDAGSLSGMAGSEVVESAVDGVRLLRMAGVHDVGWFAVRSESLNRAKDVSIEFCRSAALGDEIVEGGLGRMTRFSQPNRPDACATELLARLGAAALNDLNVARADLPSPRRVTQAVLAGGESHGDAMLRVSGRAYRINPDESSQESVELLGETHDDAMTEPPSTVAARMGMEPCEVTDFQVSVPKKAANEMDDFVTAMKSAGWRCVERADMGRRERLTFDVFWKGALWSVGSVDVRSDPLWEGMSNGTPASDHADAADKVRQSIEGRVDSAFIPVIRHSTLSAVDCRLIVSYNAGSGWRDTPRKAVEAKVELTRNVATR